MTQESGPATIGNVAHVRAGNDAPKRGERVLTYVNGPGLARPLPPTPWLCRTLQVAPGRPLLWTAAAGSGKTWCAMSFGLTVAAGLSSWLSTFPLQTQGPVLHVNLEMHKDEIARRYQRLARGMGLDLNGLPIRVTNRSDIPTSFSLMSPDALPVLTKATTGMKLCIIDSLRAFLGGVDENKSEVRDALDVLLSVTERTGCTFIVIHHEGKPPKEGQGGGSTQHRARGSSAIVDACDGTFSISAAGFPCGMRIEQGKSSMDQKGDPFFVRLVDVGEKDVDGRSPAIVVEYVHVDEVEEAGEQETATVRRAREAVLDALRVHGSLNIRQIEKGKTAQGKPFVRGNKEAKAEAVSNLLADGLVVESRAGGQRSIRLA